MLNINSGDSSFTVEKRTENIVKHGSKFCLANFLDKYVFVIGGCKEILFKSVSRYEISNDRWIEMPELNEARAYANACSLGDNVYVIGGYDNQERFTNSIEKLSNPGLTRDEASWKLIQPPDSILSPRKSPVVVPFNAN